MCVFPVARDCGKEYVCVYKFGGRTSFEAACEKFKGPGGEPIAKRKVDHSLPRARVGREQPAESMGPLHGQQSKEGKC